MGDLPPNFGGEPGGPPPAQWQPAYPTQPVRRSGTWLAIAVSAVAALLGAAALVVSLTRSTDGLSAVSPATTTTRANTAQETTSAHQKLCDAYKLAAQAVQIETNGTSQAFAGIATVNGAVMLEEAVNTNPGLGPTERAAALALAEAYSNVAATASLAGGQDPAWQAALSDANAKDAAMKKVCGGG